jgi:microcin C transport system substrate-binding protein
MKNILWAICFLWAGIQTTFADTPPPPSSPTHGVSVYGKLKYPSEFSHFDYTNPIAPKGGTLHLGFQGTFDSLNPFLVKGVPPGLIGLTMATLLEEAHDRSGEYYAYAAESVELAPDRSSVTFRLNPKAVFSNGEPVTADDVIWAFEALRTKAIPMYRTYYKNISKVEKLDDRTIKFTFNATTNRELPMILGQLPILSKKFYQTHPFDQTTLTPGPSSGPFEIESVSAGHSFNLKHVENWWGASLPSQKGRHNFDKIRSDYYLESNALFEGFKSGQYDVRHENLAKNWATAYDFPAFQKGHVKREEIKHSLSSGTFGLVFNTRRPLFADIRVRKALTLLLDFPWINKHLFYGLYKRNTSYFPNSDFEAKGPPSEEEKAILMLFKDQVSSEILTQSFTLPTPVTEMDHRNLQEEAQKLLKEAGYELKDTVMTDIKTGKPLRVEMLIYDKSLEKITNNFTASLKRLGIQLNTRNLDPAAYQLRVDELNFDMVIMTIPQSASLGNEQRDYFGSEKANTPGTRNLCGIKNPVVDQLIEQLINASSFKELTNTSKALDRVLLWNYYMIPAWHSDALFVAYWDRFSRPKISPKYLPLDFTTWWFDEEKDAKITSGFEEKKPQGHEDKGMIEKLWEKVHTLRSEERK